MSTPTITLKEIENSDKFQAIKNYFTADSLDLINRSETMKSMVRSYQLSENTIEVKLWTTTEGNPSGAQYRVPNNGERGQLYLGANRINTATGLVNVLSHELGHFVVENPGAVISNARANAWEAKDKAAYAEACNLTEGYARKATAKVMTEINDNTAQSALPSNLLREVGTWFISNKEYNEYKQLLPVVAQESWTFDEMDRALAFALGESNKSNATSTGGETYLQFCSRRGNAVYQSGQTAPANAPAVTALGDLADGSSSIETELNDGRSFKSKQSEQDTLSQTIEIAVDAQGNPTQTTATDYTYSGKSDAYSVVRTIKDTSGRVLSRTEVQTYDDGSRFEYKTEGGKNYIQAIDEDGKVSGWKEYKTPAQEQATNAMYSDMAGFVNALRGKDKVNQLLYAAKIGINYQISQGSTQLALGAQVIKGLVSCANDNSWRKTA